MVLLPKPRQSPTPSCSVSSPWLLGRRVRSYRGAGVHDLVEDPRHPDVQARPRDPRRRRHRGRAAEGRLQGQGRQARQQRIAVPHADRQPQGADRVEDVPLRAPRREPGLRLGEGPQVDLPDAGVDQRHQGVHRHLQPQAQLLLRRHPGQQAPPATAEAPARTTSSTTGRSSSSSTTSTRSTSPGRRSASARTPTSSV